MIFTYDSEYGQWKCRNACKGVYENPLVSHNDNLYFIIYTSTDGVPAL